MDVKDIQSCPICWRKLKPKKQSIRCTLRCIPPSSFQELIFARSHFLISRDESVYFYDGHRKFKYKNNILTFYFGSESSSEWKRCNNIEDLVTYAFAK